MGSSHSRKVARRDQAFRPLVAPRLLRRPQAAEYLSLSPSQLDLLRAQGEISPVPVPSERSSTGLMSGAVLYDVRDLDALIERWKWRDHDQEVRR